MSQPRGALQIKETFSQDTLLYCPSSDFTEQRPSVDIVERLARALDVPSQDLIGPPPAPRVTAEDMRFVREYLALSAAKKLKLRQLIDIVVGPKKR